MRKGTFLVLMMLIILFSENGYAKNLLVSSVDELNQIPPKVQAGDRIIFSDKNWVDAQTVLKVSGTGISQLKVLPQTVGVVIFEINGGTYLIVKFLKILKLYV